jgi:hypothetical protein
MTEKPHVTLLRHIADVWDKGAWFLTTDELLKKLRVWHLDSWGPSEKYTKEIHER